VQNRDIKAVVRYSNAATGVVPTFTSCHYTDSCVDGPYAFIVPVVSLDSGAANFREGAVDVVVQVNSVQTHTRYLFGTTFFSEYDSPTLLDINRHNSNGGNLLVKIPNWGVVVSDIMESPISVPHPINLHR
jgi:hypothetical protein